MTNWYQSSSEPRESMEDVSFDIMNGMARLIQIMEDTSPLHITSLLNYMERFESWRNTLLRVGSSLDLKSLIDKFVDGLNTNYRSRAYTWSRYFLREHNFETWEDYIAAFYERFDYYLIKEKIDNDLIDKSKDNLSHQVFDEILVEDKLIEVEGKENRKDEPIATKEIVVPASTVEEDEHSSNLAIVKQVPIIENHVKHVIVNEQNLAMYHRRRDKEWSMVNWDELRLGHICPNIIPIKCAYEDFVVVQVAEISVGLMSHIQGAPKYTCNLLTDFCGRNAENEQKKNVVDGKTRYPFPDIVSSGRLEVQTLINSSADEISKVMDSWQPNIVYLQGQQLPDGGYGSLVRGGVDFSTPETIYELFSSVLPTTIYLELPKGEKLEEALQSRGIPDIIFLKHRFSFFEAGHFRHALFSVVQSSSCHTRVNSELGLDLIGEPPKINVPPPEAGPDDEKEEGSSSDFLPSIKIYDKDVNMRFLVCDDISTGSSAHISLLVSGSAQMCFDDQLLENHIKSEIIDNARLVHTPPTSEEGAETVMELFVGLPTRTHLLSRNTLSAFGWLSSVQPLYLGIRRCCDLVLGNFGRSASAKSWATQSLAFRMSVLYFDVDEGNEKITRASIAFPLVARRIDTLNDLLATIDLMSLHCELTNETIQIINADCLRHIKPGCALDGVDGPQWMEARVREMPTVFILPRSADYSEEVWMEIKEKTISILRAFFLEDMSPTYSVLDEEGENEIATENEECMPQVAESALQGFICEALIDNIHLTAEISQRKTSEQLKESSDQLQSHVALQTYQQTTSSRTEAKRSRLSKNSTLAFEDQSITDAYSFILWRDDIIYVFDPGKIRSVTGKAST